MKRVCCSDPERLIFRQRIGWGIFFALPFYLFFTAVGGIMWFFNTGDMQHGIGPLIFLFFFGIWLVFVVATAVHWFGRVGVDIDRHERTVTTSWGLLFPILPAQHRLDAFRTVLLDFQVRQCGKSKIHEWIVLLSDGKNSEKIGRGEDYPQMRTVAEEIARFVRLPLIDVSQGEPRLVDLSGPPRRESLRDRAAPLWPPTPESTKVNVERVGDEVTFHLPTASIGCFSIWCFIALAYLGFMVFLGTESHWNWKPMAIYGVIFGLILLFFFALAKPTREVVSADPERVKITTHGLLFSSAKEIAWHEVKELTRSFKHVSLLTNTQKIGFGNTRILESDAEWMRDVLDRYWRG